MMNDKELNEYYDFLVNQNIATEEEIQLVTCINGWNEESLDNILYVRTGYRTKEQYIICEVTI